MPSVLKTAKRLRDSLALPGEAQEVGPARVRPVGLSRIELQLFGEYWFWVFSAAIVAECVPSQCTLGPAPLCFESTHAMESDCFDRPYFEFSCIFSASHRDGGPTKNA